MDYFNYLDLLPTDNIPINHKEYQAFRKLYRIYKSLGRYINAAILQFNRIEEWAIQQKSLGDRIVSGDDLIETELIFSDLHFLIISIDRCYELESELYAHILGKDKSKKFDHIKEVNDIRIMRNTLEHHETELLNDYKNKRYKIEQVYEDNGWSWIEYQLSSLKNGKFKIKDKSLELSYHLFDTIFYHHHILTEHLRRKLS